jgi:polar amino acid transport system substrate-binding protein
MKKSIFSIFLLAALLVIYSASNCRADRITIVADYWCPINCDPSSLQPGLMVEIAQIVFANAGHTIEYKIVPWARAIQDSREGKFTGIIGALRGDAPDFIFPENELLMVSPNAFFVKNDSKWSYNDIASLSNVKLAAVSGYDYGEILNEYIKKEGKNVDLASGEDAGERNIKKLLMGRVDVIVEAAPVLWYTAAKIGVTDQLKAAGQVSEAVGSYIAFSPAIAKSKEYARILSDGVDTLRKSGKLQEILQKYGLKDWK